jgi:hypothetical protein
MDTIDRLRWRKSSYSGGNGGACVEVAELPDSSRAVRDSKNPAGGILALTADQWQAFVAGAKHGEFDLA